MAESLRRVRIPVAKIRGVGRSSAVDEIDRIVVHAQVVEINYFFEKFNLFCRPRLRGRYFFAGVFFILLPLFVLSVGFRRGILSADDGLKLWLALFNAETEEDLARIEALEVSVMQEAIGAYRHVAATDEFREIERLRSRARHNEASALSHARDMGKIEGERIGAEREREKWQGVVEEQAALIAQLRAQIGKNT